MPIPIPSFRYGGPGSGVSGGGMRGLLERLDGMYVFAVYDETAKRILIARIGLVLGLFILLNGQVFLPSHQR